MPKRITPFPLCRHIKTDGRLCQSPARGRSAFCYHHQRQRTPSLPALDAVPTLSPHVLHPLRNARSIQHALSMILLGVAGNRITTAQAGRMLRAIEIAHKTMRPNRVE